MKTKKELIVEYLKNFIARWDIAQEEGDHDVIATLSEELNYVCAAYKLPQYSADELLYSISFAESVIVN
jgi:hypothetical protein